MKKQLLKLLMVKHYLQVKQKRCSVLDNDCFFPEDVEEFWQQDKKARKSDFTFGKNYYTQGTKGVATLDVTYVVEEDKTKGSAKIKQFVPMEIADESI